MTKTNQFSSLLSQELRQLLAEIAFLGSGYGLDKESKTIFQFLEQVANGQVYPTVGQALIFLNQGEVNKAVQLLNDKITGDQQLASEELATLRCFLGLALSCKGAKKDSKAQLQLSRSEPSSNPEVQKLAQALIDQQLSKR